MKTRDLCATRLMELLSYDKETGIFVWNVRRNRHKKGSIAGITKQDSPGLFYTHITIDGVSHFAHRLAYLYMTGSHPDEQIDHIDGNGANNKWSNLRSVDQQTNHKNKKKLRSNKSGKSGVCFHKQVGKWYARISNDGVRVNLGLFNDFDEACAARDRAEIEYGYHKNHGR